MRIICNRRLKPPNKISGICKGKHRGFGKPHTYTYTCNLHTHACMPAASRPDHDDGDGDDDDGDKNDDADDEKGPKALHPKIFKIKCV